MSADDVWRSPSMDGTYPVRVLDEWRVVDKWTDTPVVRHFQEVVEGGRTYVRVRENADGSVWADWEQE